MYSQNPNRWSKLKPRRPSSLIWNNCVSEEVQKLEKERKKKEQIVDNRMVDLLLQHCSRFLRGGSEF